jgi:regulatory protein
MRTKNKEQATSPLSREQIIQKLENYCGYRERCESEIRQKLYQLHAQEADYPFYLDYLRQHNFLNEERFVNAFVRGKNSIKKWGKKRIEMELKFKKIDEKKIKQSLETLDEGMYLLHLEDILLKKIKTIRETDPYKKRQKLFQFALQKGYEADLINEVLKNTVDK